MQACRPVRLVLAVTIAAIVASACSSTSTATFRGGEADSASKERPVAPAEEPNALGGSDPAGGSAGDTGTGHPGVDLVPLHIPAFVFGDAVIDPTVQPGSRQLADGVVVTKRLHVMALPSANGTAAIDFLEISPPKHLWGEQLIPAERGLFRDFAADASLGNALVIIDDVQVTEGPDPLPMTAYRWERADVEAYARCGIPDREIEGCTQAFYRAAEMVLVGLFGDQRGA